MIVGVLGWRWALVEATTDYGPDPDSLVVQPVTQAHATLALPPIEVTVLDVHSAPPAPRAASGKASSVRRGAARPANARNVR